MRKLALLVLLVSGLALSASAQSPAEAKVKIDAIKAEAQAVLDLNTSLRRQSKLPTLVLDSQKRIITLADELQGIVFIRPTAITAASCEYAAVSSAVSSAVDGNTVVIPPCAETTWTSRLVIDKAIHLQGAGAGEIVGDSETSVTVGTGSKVFTTQSGEDYTGGETITARYSNGGGDDSMTGTVTSYSGTTLTLNITSVTGSGTYQLWQFERNPASRTIIKNGWADAATEGLIDITEDTGGSVRISGIRFQASTTLTNGFSIIIRRTVGDAYPTLIHDNWFDDTGTAGGNGAIISKTNRGVVYNNTFTSVLCAHKAAGCAGASVTGAVVVHDDSGGLDDSWTTAPTWGADDTTGRGNFYVEDNFFLAYWQSLSGCDSGARIVWRYNRISQSALAGHGADTSPLGVRYCEVYNNTFYYVDLPDVDVSYNVNFAIDMRGGSYVVTDNVFSDFGSPGEWNDKVEINMQVQNLRRVDSQYPCWGDGVHATYGSLTYPAYHQVGRGTYNGSNPLTSTGASDPVYVWGNTGHTLQYGISNYDPNGCAAGAADISTYIQENRDYYKSARPSYTKYTYPHPARQ